MIFKYLLQECSVKLLELIKQKSKYPYEHMNSFKRSFDDRLPDRQKGIKVKVLQQYSRSV